MLTAALHEHDDAALLRRCADGDREAFRVVIERHTMDLAAFCRRFSRDPHDAQDLCQDVLMKAWRHCAGFDGRSSVRTWLYRIVVNTAIDGHRRSLRRPIPVADIPQTDAVQSPETEVVVREELREALREVPEHYRIVVILADGMGWPYAEIAALCRIPEATVRSRLSRGRKALRNLLEGTDA